MIYGVLRALAGIALRWYYESIEVDGVERVPASGPLLVAVNHPNALVDALVAGWMLPRRVLITAKATLFTNPVAGALLRRLGVVPLRRASDEQGVLPDAARNAETFRAVVERLAAGGAVLIFPEGKSHDDPALAPLRTGAARMALAAREAGVRGLRIVPIGLTFERKDSPRTRVYAQVGEPIDVDAWPAGDAAPRQLTAELEQRLRAVTLNFDSPADAARATALASLFSRMLAGERAVGAPPRSLAGEVALVRRIERARLALAAADAPARARADALVSRLAAFEDGLRERGLRLEDVEIARTAAPGARFTVREGAVAMSLGPLAAWGRLNHWIPFNAARAIATAGGVKSAADPAMRTMVAGLALVLVFYVVQAAVVWRIAGGAVAAVYLATLPLAADANFLLETRLRRARRRARAYFLFRRDPALQDALVAELRWLRDEAAAVERVLAGAVAEPSVRNG